MMVERCEKLVLSSENAASKSSGESYMSRSMQIVPSGESEIASRSSAVPSMSPPSSNMSSKKRWNASVGVNVVSSSSSISIISIISSSYS